MLTSLNIQNFRCFSDVTVESLKHINLIVGRNNVGKTTFLEAVFLLSGGYNPRLPMIINGLRGIQSVEGRADVLWGRLFRESYFDQPIKIKAVDEKGRVLSLQISIKEATETKYQPADGKDVNAGSDLSTAENESELVLEYNDGSGRINTSRAVITPQGIDLLQERAVSHPTAIFVSTRMQFNREDAHRFSALAKKGQEGVIGDALKLLEPRLKRIVLLMEGDQPVLYGDIGLPELLPLPLMGEGMVRLLTILVDIAFVEGGKIFIDEIDIGFHHSIVKDVWQIIGSLAREFNVQVFATTHNLECVKAAHEAFAQDDADPFRLHRLEWCQNAVRARTYEPDTLATALSAELEVR